MTVEPISIIAKYVHFCSRCAFGPTRCDFVPRTIEEKLVPLVDYLTEYDQQTTLDRRFSSLRERNGGNSFFTDRLDRAQKSARLFMEKIEEEIGESVEGIVANQ